MLGILIAAYWSALLGNHSNIGVIVTQDFTSGEDNILRPMQLYWPDGIIKDWNSQKHRLTLCNNHIIRFASAENPDSMKGLSKVAWWWMDEAALHKKWVHDILIGRGIDLQAPGLITTTPKHGAGNVWLKPVFDKGSDPKTSGDGVPYNQRHFSYNMSTWDNPHIPKEERSVIRAAYSGPMYEQEIMGNFVTDELLVFRSELLTPERCGYFEEELQDHELNNYMTIDPAFSESDVKGHSESAILGFGVGADYGIFIRESWASMVDSHKLEIKTLDMQQKYQALKVGCEAVSGAIVLVDNMRRAQSVDQTFPIVELKRRGGQDNKRTRAMAAVPYLENRLLRFPVDEYGNFLHGTDKLIEQMLSFTGQKGETNDRVDTLSDIFNPDMNIIEGVHVEAAAYRRQRDPSVVTVMSSSEFDLMSYDSEAEDGLNLRLN